MVTLLFWTKLMQKVWKAIRKIKGKDGSNSVNHLKVNSMLITD